MKNKLLFSAIAVFGILAGATFENAAIACDKVLEGGKPVDQVSML